jgi:hypothetical protein
MLPTSTRRQKALGLPSALRLSVTGWSPKARASFCATYADQPMCKPESWSIIGLF